MTPEVLLKGDHKLVRFDLRPGTRYRGVKIEIEGAGTDRAQEILALLQRRAAPAIRLSGLSPGFGGDQRDSTSSAATSPPKWQSRSNSWTRSGGPDGL